MRLLCVQRFSTLLLRPIQGDSNTGYLASVLHAASTKICNRKEQAARLVGGTSE